MAQQRTDRIIIAIALILLICAGSAFYFDHWMWGSRRARGERIGVITSRAGDVRLKFQDDLRWSRAANGQDLAYDDAVYAGAGGEAHLQVGQSQMIVGQNSLIVLRKDQNQNFLKLDYGTLLGMVAKDDKIIIDTGDGKTFELQATQKTNIVLRRENGRTQLDVTSGEANVRVDGKENKITTSSRLVFGQRTPTELQTIKLRALKPLRNDVVASAEPTRIEFDWAWDSGRRATEDERYVVEFSSRADFKELHAQKVVQGALTTSMSVSQSLSLLYRVRGPNNQLSQVERVRFVRLEAPVIVTPVADQVLDAEPGFSADVDFTFRHATMAKVAYQIAREPKFTTLAHEGHANDRARVPLAGGEYFARARAEYGGLGNSGWSATTPFRVNEKLRVLPLAQRRAPTRVLIPNADYPAEIYASSEDQTRAFLARRGFLRSALPLKRAEFDEVHVESLDDGAAYRGRTASWPTPKLSPGNYGYRYRTTKDGFRDSEWSAPARLDIAMEPPRPVGPARYGPRDDSDQTPTDFDFTPLLFARSYDVELATTPTFDDAVELKVTEPTVRTNLTEGSYYWRARARDERGRLISAYSSPHRLAPMPPAKIPRFLAAREAPAPVVVEKVVTKVTEIPGAPLDRNGWYAWLGTGENFTKYNQSLAGRGTADYHQVLPGGQFFEGGYHSSDGLSGVLTFKSTPGNARLDNATITASAYRWTTTTIEAMKRKLSSFTIRGNPVTYGMRAGLQMHRTPFLYVDQDDAVALKMNDMTTATIGFLADWGRTRWKYYSLVRYQFPLSTKADGSSQFSISPTIAFDGSIGMSYNVTDRMKLGAFLYGQWHQYTFNYVTPASTNSGFQSLFQSSADVRLGYEF